MSIQELRVRRGLTQRTIAETLGVIPQQVSNWERGVAPIPRKYTESMSTLLGIPAHTLELERAVYTLRRQGIPDALISKLTEGTLPGGGAAVTVGMKEKDA